MRRIPIAADNALDACTVERVGKENMTHESFTRRYRNTKPVILSQATLFTDNNNIIINTAKFIVDHAVPGEVDALVARDGRNFLKHELCTTRRMPLTDALTHLLFPPPTTTDDYDDAETKEEEQERYYVRIYLHDHPALYNGLDLAFLTELAFGPPPTSSTFKPHNVGLWASCAQCVTPLHFDRCHGFLAQVHGRKTFILAPPDDSTLLHRWMRGGGPGTTANSTTSPINLMAWLEGDRAERQKHSDVDEVGWFVAALGPGDVLYTPPGWWHLVVSDTASCSVLVPFDPQPDREGMPVNVLRVT